MTSNPLIIHHSDADGICAALVLWLAHNQEADLVAANYDESPPPEDSLIDRVVYVVDFSYPRDVLESIDSLAQSLMVLDHHESAKQNCKGLPFAEFDMSRSGARMAFDFALQNLNVNWDSNLTGKLDLLTQYVQDHDIWTKKLEYTDEVHACLDSFPLTLEAWFGLLQAFPHLSVGVSPDSSLVKEGKAILRSQGRMIEKLYQNHRKATFAPKGEGSKVLTVAVVNSPVLTSDLGHSLVEGEDVDFACIYNVNGEGKFTYSLRSNSSRCDVAKVAEQFGGGGHQAASGFSSWFDPSAIFEWEK
jgi:nanoRNase/pAp phosphatase (c-di-AMP/oligoRNAs hydrolase)